MIFSRKGGTASKGASAPKGGRPGKGGAKGPRHAAQRTKPAVADPDEGFAADEVFEPDNLGDDFDDDFGERDGVDGDGSAARGFGPYDEADAPRGVDLLDLGSLRIPVVDGVEVRVQADQEGHVQQVVLVTGDSALQLGVFAAPRSEGIWDEVRDDLRTQLRADGLASREVTGDYGAELRSRVEAPEGMVDVRFVGVDGPRWLVRALFQGPAALDPAAAPALLECLRGLVVHRGGEAFPVREALPLRLPREIAEQQQRPGDAPAGSQGGSGGRAKGTASDGGSRSEGGRSSSRRRPRRR